MIIIGAGLSGLIAANILRKHKPVILEAQPSLPNNHHALLRFRSDAVAKATGIDFKEVNVQKGVIFGDMYVDKPNPFICNQYSVKVTGDRILQRSIWDLSPGNRYIAPPDFISQLAQGLTIEYNKPVSREVLFTGNRSVPVISTIPMPSMMKMIDPDKDTSHFRYLTVYSINADIKFPTTDVYQTLYFPALDEPCYRASITGSKLTIEMLIEDEKLNLWDKELIDEYCYHIAGFFGLDSKWARLGNVTMSQQRYGKLAPIDDDERKQFMYDLTRDSNIYSLGRFATWRQILLDDLVKDVKIIESLINRESNRGYQQSLLTIN